MEDWIPARKVKGLFDSAAAAPAAPKAAPTPADEPESPPPAAAPPAGPTFDAPPAASEPTPKPRRERTGRHPFDLALDLLRGQFPAPAIDAAAGMFTQVGHFGLYAAMGLSLVVSLLLAVDTDLLLIIPVGIAAALVLAVLQYASGKFLVSLQRLNRSSPGSLCSTAFLDCFALFLVVLGAAALVGLALAAVLTGYYSLLLSSLAAFIFCEYAAFVALHPASVHLRIDPSARAGEEAIGILTFLLKTVLKLTPVAFGAGVAIGSLRLVWAGYLAVASDSPDETLSFTAVAVGSVLVYAALPVLVYLVFLSAYLGMDVIRAVLSLPGKLDRLAGEKEEDA